MLTGSIVTGTKGVPVEDVSFVDGDDVVDDDDNSENKNIIKDLFSLVYICKEH